MSCALTTPFKRTIVADNESPVIAGLHGVLHLCRAQGTGVRGVWNAHNWANQLVHGRLRAGAWSTFPHLPLAGTGGGRRVRVCKGEGVGE